MFRVLSIAPSAIHNTVFILCAVDDEESERAIESFVLLHMDRAERINSKEKSFEFLGEWSAGARAAGLSVNLCAVQSEF